MQKYLLKQELKKLRKFVIKIEKRKFEKLNAKEATLIKLLLSNGYIIDLFDQDVDKLKQYLNTH